MKLTVVFREYDKANYIPINIPDIKLNDKTFQMIWDVTGANFTQDKVIHFNTFIDFCKSTSLDMLAYTDWYKIHYSNRSIKKITKNLLHILHIWADIVSKINNFEIESSLYLIVE